MLWGQRLHAAHRDVPCGVTHHTLTFQSEVDWQRNTLATAYHPLSKTSQMYRWTEPQLLQSVKKGTHLVEASWARPISPHRVVKRGPRPDTKGSRHRCWPTNCLKCSVLFCSVLFCSVLFCSVLFCRACLFPFSLHTARASALRVVCTRGCKVLLHVLAVCVRHCFMSEQAAPRQTEL